MTLLPILDQSHKGWVIKIEKVALENKTTNFGHFLLSSDQTLYLQEKKLFYFQVHFNCWTFEENKDQKQWFARKCAALKTHGYIQPNNLCSALSSFPSVMLPFRSLPIRSLMWVCTTGCQKTKPYLFCRIKCISGGNSDSFSSP